MQRLVVFALALLLMLGGCGFAQAPAATQRAVSGDEGASSVQEGDLSSEIRALLPPGRLKVDILDLRPPPRFAALSEKLQAAVAEDPEWWADYSRAAQSGEPLPYHPDMGLSEEEYQELLALSEQIELVTIDSTTIAITQQRRGRLHLDGGDKLPELSGLEIDLRQGLLRTPYGLSAEPSRITQGEGRAIGPWKGVQWKIEDLDMEQGAATVAKLALGTFQESGRGLLRYDVQQIPTIDVEPLVIVLAYDR